MSLSTARGLSESEEDRAFLQKRVALFGLIVGGGYLFFWLYRAVAMLIDAYYVGFREQAFWWHLLAAVAFLALGLSCQRTVHSVRYIRMGELTALSVGVLATGAMAMHIPFAHRPDYILLLALTNVVIGRAIFVPSSGRWTLMLGCVIGVLLVGSVYMIALRMDVDRWSAFLPKLTERGIDRAALSITIEAAVYWMLAILLSTAGSLVIYGLRRQVRAAQHLGQYRLEEKVGEGGMGVVYRATHAFLRRPTAVKLLPPDKAGAENLRRFEQEVQLTASLSHPNTITIFDYGHTSDGVFYYAMEYVRGLSLADVVARSGAQPQGRVVHLMRQVASALIEAHGIGMVHRDIKPSNIMVQLLHDHDDGEDFAKVLDFGLVKEVRQEGGIDLTNEANISGTPQYMSPEAITSPENIDARADIYALGAVAYYLLTGTHLFTGRSIVEVCSHHLHTAPEAPSARLGNPIDPALEQLILQCLAKDPAVRPQSTFELKQRLSGLSQIPLWTPHDARSWWDTHGERAPTEAARGDASFVTVELDGIARRA
ncbi:MAG: serine/threonine-protein kinase [Polyangiales bacterium]